MSTGLPNQSDPPVPFANPTHKPHIAVVRGLSKGSFIGRYLMGVQSMAAELGIELSVFDASGEQEMLAMAQDAIQQRVDAIIINHGRLDNLRPAIETALNQNIRVVAFDLIGEHPQVPAIEQDDMLIGYILSRQVAIDYGGKANVIYINADGFAPLVKRDRIWQDFKWRYPELNEVARLGAVSEDTATATTASLERLIEEHPDASVIVAMWDEFAKGAVRAITQRGLAERVKVYSVDITDEDIQMMTAPGSPWVTTVATDAFNTGRLAVRAAAALLAGEKVSKYLLVEPHLITQEFLTTNRITNMDELVKALPFLGESRHVWFDWMEQVLARGGYRKPVAALPPEQLVAQLQTTLSTLEWRNTQLQMAAEVSHIVGGIHDLKDLMQRSVNLVRERFGLYYVGLFLVHEGSLLDYPQRKWAVLHAATGEAGQAMLNQRHSLQVGGDSMIGQCVATGKARTAQDVAEETVRFTNPLLPETRSELALPLISRGETIGALTIQSSERNAFGPEDISVLQTMAGQLANAIENVRLLGETEAALEELKAAQRQYVRAGWSEYLGKR